MYSKNDIELRKEYIQNCFSDLNEMQRKAVFSVNGSLLILAGAGSGKTTVLVNRIANLIRFGSAYESDVFTSDWNEEDRLALSDAVQNHKRLSLDVERKLQVEAVYPWHILAITFTNKAAGELKKRISDMLGATVGNDVNASTFHSACVRILRREAEALGYPSSFTIYDTDDQKRVLKEVYKAHSVDEKFLSLKTCLNAISRMKDQLITPEDSIEMAAGVREQLVAKLYSAYQLRLKNAGAMDFDDLIFNTVLLFKTNPQILKKYNDRYRYILVDEYQDTSVAQFELVRQLAGELKNLCVVGDDDQSIYRFRGATIENILSFEEHFKGSQVIRLEQNYRSTPNILNAANSVIQNNKGRKGKTLWTELKEGDNVSHYVASDETHEAAKIAEVISNNVKNGVPLKAHAVLYRMNAQSGPIETYFARAGIPYKIIGGQRFYDRKEVKDILAYLAIVANCKDDVRLRRIINEPGRKIGDSTVDKIAQLAQQKNLSMLEICLNAVGYQELGRSQKAIIGFTEIYKRLCKAERELPLDEFVSEAIDISGYRQMLEGQAEEGQSRLENLGQLVSSVKLYADQRGPEASLQGFLEEVALISDLDTYDESSDVVVMMTIHAAKGLEYDYVFVAGMEEGIFPGEQSKYNDEDMEEERRLCYVAFTRAKKRLYISNCESRMLFGQTRRNYPSHFIEEIDTMYLDEEQSRVSAGHREDSYRRMRRMEDEYFPTSYGSSRFSGTNYDAYQSYGGNTYGDYQKKGGYLNADYNRSGSSKAVPQSYGSSIKSGISTPNVNSTKDKDFKPGDRVDHKVFGLGVVLEVTPIAGDKIVKIRFEKVGEKKTMANYAPLKKIDD